MTERKENWDIQTLRRFGKWSEPNVPHKDWFCVAEFDALDEYGALIDCEMCEKQSIRFVHLMENARYDGQLKCGCVCASHMSGDRNTAELREKRMRSRATRKRAFPKRKGWKVSARGNPNIKADGVHIVITHNRNGEFRIGSRNAWEKDFTGGSEGYATSEEAKVTAFEIYDKLRVV